MKSASKFAGQYGVAVVGAKQAGRQAKDVASRIEEVHEPTLEERFGPGILDTPPEEE